MSKVNVNSIQQETIGRLNRFDHITPEKKRIIRTEGIYNLINSKESGHLFTVTELIKAAGYRPNGTQGDKEYWRGSSLINELISKGVLRRYREGANRFSPCSYDIDSIPAFKAKLKYQLRGPSNKKKDPRIVITTVDEVTTAQQPVQAPAYELTAAEDEPTNDVPVKQDQSCAEYSFTFTLRKKSQSVTGDKEIAAVSLSETTLEKITEIVNNVIKVSK